MRLKIGINRAYLLAPVLALVLLPSNVVAAALPLLRTEWSTSSVAAGWVFAAYQMGYLLGVLILLPLTDRVSAGRVIAACTAMTSVAFFLFPFLAGGVWSAAGLRVLAGIGLAGIYLPGVRVIASAVEDERRGFAVGAYVSAFYLGSATSLWFTGLLLPRFGWRGAALVLGLVSVGALPLAVLSARKAVAPAGSRARFDPAVLRNGPVMRTISAYTGHAWELYVSRGWLAAFVASVLVARGLSETDASALGSQWAALMAGFGTPGVWLGGWLSDHLGRARAALAIALTSGVLSLGFGFLGSTPWLVFLTVGCLYGLVQSADSAIYSTAITELAAPGRLGSAQAVQAFVGFGMTVVAPVAAGWVLDVGLGWGGVFVGAGVVGVALALPLISPVMWKRNDR